MQKEIDTVVGTSRQPSLTDRPNLPYTEAVIMEVLRLSNVFPNGVMHRMLDDFEFHGFLFPKGVTVISNLYKILHDPEIWGDADTFRPERFLSEDGKKLVKHEAFVPFSVGKRQCLGESLARDTLFLIITCIFQKYTIISDPEKPIPDFEPPPGFLHETKHFKFLVKNREP
ncbi:Cytochrome P450 2D4 [Orchesella cincta]|uniref:Cytochrome P450 2D4 n=1 Tax=Orchesella cincta TaxID=48709 RepID=A0A1D2N522_ORCCI|nr:Cytochrome P450 2D4 [Orchesella cincta]